MIAATIIFVLLAASLAGAVGWWLTSTNLSPERCSAASESATKAIDWFLWESEQIQHGGYAPWFDHWRYEGEPGAYLDPTPEQRAKVFSASLTRAREHYGEERLNDLIAQAVERLLETGLPLEAAYRRVAYLGQDPVRFAIDIAEGRRDAKDLH